MAWEYTLTLNTHSDPLCFLPVNGLSVACSREKQSGSAFKGPQSHTGPAPVSPGAARSTGVQPGVGGKQGMRGGVRKSFLRVFSVASEKPAPRTRV